MMPPNVWAALTVAALLGILLVVAPRLTRALCARWNLVKPNFQAVSIPAALGLTFLLVACPIYVCLLLFAYLPFFPPALTGAFLLTVTGFGLLGLIDDRWGSRNVGGFKGHIKALLRGKPTTGGAKLLGGGLVALGAAYLAGCNKQSGLFPDLVDAALIALAANTLNLLDVRPGRALFGFAVLSSVAACATLCALAGSPNDALTTASGFLLLLPVVLAAVFEVLPDARARGMMGDTGSNLLGASAGLACVLVLPFWARVVVALLLLALNGLAERVSLSALISQTPFLARVDRKLGVR